MGLSATALLCCLDDFAETPEDRERHRLIPATRKRRRQGRLSPAGMLFIMVLFHLPPFRDFRHFRRYGVEQKYRDCFGELPSYGRFVALMPRPFAPFCVLIHSPCGEGTGIHIADSTGLAVCASPRIPRNRTFRGPAARGRSTMGRFPGFRPHVVMNHRGALMAIRITAGKTDDREPLENMVAGLEGKLLADSGHIPKPSSQGCGKEACIGSPACAGT